MTTEIAKQEEKPSQLQTIGQTESERLIGMAIEQKVPIETMERLLAMKERIEANNAKKAFFEAMSEFQGRCPIIPKDHTAGSFNFKYRYAPLETIVKHIAPLLKEVGLSYRFDTEDGEKDKTIICIIYHIGGHSESSRFRVPIDAGGKMNDTQKQGSAGTYAKRYALCNALGILTGEDDDDAHGTQPPETTKKITDQQIKLLMVLFNQLGITVRESRLALVEEILNVKVTSSQDLTFLQASTTIDYLQNLTNERNKK